MSMSTHKQWQLSVAHNRKMTCRFLLLIICFTVVFAARGGGRGGGGRGSYGRGGGGHSYPSSHGLSGNTYSGYKPSNTHTYPGSTGLSGNNHRTSYAQRNEVHNHYHYAPPTHISHGSQAYPVYTGSPPSYVYVYKDSGSRYNNLLTGLALYNLGRMSNSHGYHDHNYYNRPIDQYSGNPGEVCKLGIRKSNGEYEETRIDCRLMSSFIWDAEREKTSATNSVTTVNVTQTMIDGNTTVTFQNTTAVEALETKGSSIPVTPGMQCYMIRVSRDSSVLKRNVECSVLQAYATQSLRYAANKCTRIVSMILSLIVPFLATLLW